MGNNENLRLRILFSEARGIMGQDEALGALSVLNGAPILKPVQSAEDVALGRDQIYETLDSNGEVLIAGENYLLNEKKVKVLREENGGGNMLDVHMRIYYLDSELEERFTTVDGKYTKGILEGVTYPSRFEPIREIE